MHPKSFAFEMTISKYELLRKAAGYMLAAANAGIREEKKNMIIKDVIVKNAIEKHKRTYTKKK